MLYKLNDYEFKIVYNDIQPKYSNFIKKHGLKYECFMNIYVKKIMNSQTYYILLDYFDKKYMEKNVLIAIPSNDLIDL
jgi:hypothetical protein